MLRLAVLIETRIADLKADMKGVTAMEYGLIAAFTVAAVGAVIVAIGGDLTAIWGDIKTQLDAAKTAA